MQTERTEWELNCPFCRVDLGALPVKAASINCSACGSTYPCQDGIWRFLPADALKRLTPFLDDYVKIRGAEGWGSSDPDYLNNLPAVPAGDPYAGIWRI